VLIAFQTIQPTSILKHIVVVVGEDSFKLRALSGFSSLSIFNMLLATSEASRT
jgi:hypothetical protein